MSGVGMLHFSKERGKFIQIHQYYWARPIMALKPMYSFGKW